MTKNTYKDQVQFQKSQSDQTISRSKGSIPEVEHETGYVMSHRFIPVQIKYSKKKRESQGEELIR